MEVSIKPDIVSSKLWSSIQKELADNQFKLLGFYDKGYIIALGQRSKSGDVIDMKGNIDSITLKIEDNPFEKKENFYYRIKKTGATIPRKPARKKDKNNAR